MADHASVRGWPRSPLGVAALEAIPFAGMLLMLALASGYSAVWPMLPLAPVAAASGLGWAAAGRPRFGFVMAGIRVIAFIVAAIVLYAILLNALCEGNNCMSWHHDAYWAARIALWPLILFVLLWPVGSALAAAYVVHKDRDRSSRTPAHASAD